MTHYAIDPVSRIIPYQGANNFRDMGGYETEDGRRVKYGLFFRSAELHGLTENDLLHLHTLGIRTVLDYRHEQEAALKPDPAIAGAVYECIPAFAADLPIAAAQSHTMEELLGGAQTGGFGPEMLAGFYAKLPFGNASYRRLMDLIQEPERLGLLHHCAAGKDRTGVGSALILLALGVPEETVMLDYLLTNEGLASFKAEILARIAPALDERALQGFQAIMAAKPEYLNAALDAIKERYGSYEAYFEQEYGLTAGRLDALRSYCLETI
ncbi:Protein tyrosine/serine phosphatase [Paenibacillus mucilaginosus 3016]|uniref:Protein tyrosine/serine phosphatase n=2 Tax=Paenibacillus mucilaginosus TaxID=61624 RepID=H6NI32_9BACL|nr:tyrosine-protein phosphatase [Paenibacillus mucilaginosus]AFC30803.1 Protein tyrosine/serine phosphatase [Paenibacillus mucilaginosus 3016]AFH63125.1 protein tyrosine phosphatase [Paenibacillus mucilaginosus K02]WFA19409.1 tyrosine-protein phosphatase [Paenibacillus mucilaginosus]